MSDNITLPQGAGTLLATDEILGVHVLRAKLQTGADGTAVDVSQTDPLPVSQVGSLPAGTNTIGAVHVAGSLPAGTNTIGAVNVAGSLPTGANTIGAVNVAGSLPTGTNTIGAVNVKPATSGGLSIYRHTGLSTTGQSVKSSAGQVFGWHLANWSSSEAFVKLYNTAGAPTVGTTQPALTLMVPAGQVISAEHTNGIAFTNGIGIGATAAASDNNTSQPGPNTIIVNVFYK